MTRFSCALICALLVGLIAQPAPVAAFETYKVVGVAAGDKLTIRAEPEEGGKPTDWAALGALSADAVNVLGTGRSKEVGKQRWTEIVAGGTTGWVNTRFLAVADEPEKLEHMTFLCAGTEPFWGVTLGPKDGEFSTPETKAELTVERVQPAMGRFFPLLYRLRGQNGQALRATVSHQTWCSDGMSDYDFAFQVFLSDDENFYEGCCRLRR